MSITSEQVFAFEHKRFTTGDVTKVSGLSYRAINDWTERAGITFAERDGEAGWRRYTFDELLALTICAALKSQLPVPLESIGSIFKWLTSPREDRKGGPVWEEFKWEQQMQMCERIAKENPVFATVWNNKEQRRRFVEELRNEKHSPVTQVMGAFTMVVGIPYGQGVVPTFLVSDLQTHVICASSWMDTLIPLFASRSPVLVLSLNPIIEDVMKKLGVADADFTKAAIKSVTDSMLTPIPTKREGELLNLLRDRKYHKLTIVKKDGEIVQAHAEEDLDAKARRILETKLAEIIKAHDYQTVTLSVLGGEVVKLGRKLPIRFPKAAGKT